MLLTIKEASEQLHVNPNYVYKLIRLGFLPALKLGSLKIRPEALDEFLKTYEGQDVDALIIQKEVG